MTIFFIEKTTTEVYAPRSTSQCDTDSGLIGIGNRCSACMSHISANFVGELQKCKRIIKEFGGQIHYNAHISTLK